MFSIIIPLYNKAPYIEKAIRSVLVQSFQEFELIVIDDGSTDDSLDKLRVLSSELREINSEFIKKLRILEQKNQGVSVTRNNGVKLAKYDLIAFLDADDWWDANYLLEMNSLITKYPEAAIYASSYYKVKNSKMIPAQIGVENGFTEGYINYFKAYSKSLWMPVTSITATLRKSVFEEMNGFSPQLKLGEDFDLWARVAIKYPVAFLNKPLAYYNQDVDQNNRGVVDFKIYEPNTHFIFNMDYLSVEENQNPDLKNLLDRLRVYTLLRYRIQNAYIREVNCEIAKVDFSKQSFKALLQFKLPIFFIMIFYQTKDKIIKLIKTLINEKNH